jgi:hypothetical protein
MGKGSWIARLAITLAIMVGSSACDAQTKTITLPEFQTRVVEAMARRHPDAKITRVGTHQIQAQVPGKELWTTNLDRVFGLYEGTPGELETIVNNMASSMDAADAAVTADTLIVIVRPEEFTLAGQDSSHERALNRQVAPGLFAIVAIDRPDSYAVHQGSLLRQELKMDDAALWARATANTRTHWGAPQGALPGKGISEITKVDGLASSLLIDGAFWDSPVLAQGAPVVVAVFARDNLLLARLSDIEAVGRLRKTMAGVRDDPNGLTNDLIVRRNGHWELLP